MNEVTKSNIKQVVLIILGLVAVAILGSWAFNQGTTIRTIAWVVFAGSLVTAIAISYGVVGAITRGFKKLFKRNEV